MRQEKNDTFAAPMRFLHEIQTMALGTETIELRLRRVPSFEPFDDALTRLADGFLQ